MVGIEVTKGDVWVGYGKIGRNFNCWGYFRNFPTMNTELFSIIGPEPTRFYIPRPNSIDVVYK